MFKSKTLFVVGAGASKEVGLPIGKDLKSIIASKLDIRFRDGYTQNSGDKTIMDLFRTLAGSEGYPKDVNKFLEACWLIRDAMPQASSIDAYIDAHRENHLVAVCGKAGIASSILEAERMSKLYRDNTRLEKLDFSYVAETWFSKFFEIALDRVSESEVDAALEKVSFITFNYDRCIEHFLASALSNYYGISEQQAQEHAQKVVIHHPYGTVGPLPWQKGAGKTPFGFTYVGERALSSISRLKTFTEQIEEGEEIRAMRSAVEEAETLIFLGFAFHRQNLELIEPSTKTKVRKIFATASGISHADCSELEIDLRNWSKQDPSRLRVELRNDRTCGDLFDEYRRTFSTL
ncbi:MAG: SIR2 family protein [Parvibaculum sp.]